MMGNLVSKKDMGSTYLVEEQCWVIWAHLSYAPGNDSDTLQARDGLRYHVYLAAVPGHPHECDMWVAGSQPCCCVCLVSEYMISPSEWWYPVYLVFQAQYQDLKPDILGQRKQQSSPVFCLGWCQMDAARKLHKIWQKWRDILSDVLPVFSSLQLVVLPSQRNHLYI